MVELGRKASTVNLAPAVAHEGLRNTFPVESSPGMSPGTNELNQRGNSTRSSSSTTSLTVIRQVGSPTVEVGLHHEEQHSLQV